MVESVEIDPGISDSRIVFGQSAAFSGPAQALGNEMRLGIQAAFHEVNQAGGVHGRMVELVTLDVLPTEVGYKSGDGWLVSE